MLHNMSKLYAYLIHQWIIILMHDVITFSQATWYSNKKLQR